MLWINNSREHERKLLPRQYNALPVAYIRDPQLDGFFSGISEFIRIFQDFASHQALAVINKAECARPSKLHLTHYHQPKLEAVQSEKATIPSESH